MGEYAEKVNTSPKQRKIKAALETLGHTNVEVWWDQLESAMEMCGMGGGYSFHSDQKELEPLGYSFDEALEAIRNWSWLNVHNKTKGERDDG